MKGVHMVKAGKPLVGNNVHGLENFPDIRRHVLHASIFATKIKNGGPIWLKKLPIRICITTLTLFFTGF